MRIIKPSDPVVLYQGQLNRLSAALLKTGNAVLPCQITGRDCQAVELLSLNHAPLVLGVAFSVDMLISANFIRLLDVRTRELNVNVAVVSPDLPFALERFYHAQGLQKVSLYSGNPQFASQFGVGIEEGALAGFYTHAIFLIDKGKIRFANRPLELTSEPELDAVLQMI
jgi:thiol peroxidase